MLSRFLLAALLTAIPVLGSDEPPKQSVATRLEPGVVGAGRARSLTGAAPSLAATGDWSSVKRNDPCPCGSGRKFKKCHGVNA